MDQSVLIETLHTVAAHETVSPFLMGLTVFVLAVFVGYYVVWKVTPALHSPLMSVTNAISSVIIVGALLAAGGADNEAAQWLGFIGIVLAAINIFGGFVVTSRMLAMFSSKK
jgi:NAD(P) transhydrogenase subunit alpha